MATVLSGKVDGIVCGGGLLRFEDMRQQIRERCEWIAPVSFYPGEVEHEAMAAGALRVLRGEEEPQVYTGKPVWQGFED
jgi:butyrate kinase